VSAAAGLRIVVIGGGFGGLAAAAHLSAAGARVTIVERAPSVGGKAGRIVKDGFTFDTGPTLLTMPDVLRATFAAAGASLDERVPLARLDPICRYVFDEGGELVVHADDASTRRSLGALSPDDAQRWGAFCVECKEIWEAAGEPYLEAPFEGYLGFTQRVLGRGARAVKLGMGLGTLDALARRSFTSAQMRRFVGRFATYAGASPYEATAAFAMIPHLEHTTGAWYPRGGMIALAEALADALRARGVSVRTGLDVSAIRFDDRRRARGVITADGEILADAVVCAIDPLAALERLVPEAMARAAGVDAMRARTPSLSGFAWLAGVRGEVPASAHHTVLFPRDYAEEFRAIFERGRVCDDPTVYVAIPSLHDPSRAPAGHHAIFALVNAPATGASDWDGEATRVRDRIVARLERSFAPGIGARIVCEAQVTPRDIARTGSVGGAIYGAAPHGATAPFERPKNRAPFAKGLYFAGGATHPGGGVPMVALGGKFVAALIERDAARGRIERGRALERAS
jgi:phytoene desaturase